MIPPSNKHSDGASNYCNLVELRQIECASISMIDSSLLYYYLFIESILSSNISNRWAFRRDELIRCQIKCQMITGLDC